ncbi:MAG: double-strand break repair protein AddB, partial [Hyphomonadaceae bacterium]|nr:double-strand break repair protein AddB [Hyphomonadaceae bacterium]
LLESAAAAEEVHWHLLRDLVHERELAKHWEASASFLDIVARYWPQRLRADGLADPGARRSGLLLALTAEWERAPPQRPVVIAGSTGSIAATRAVMAAAARLPRGVVVLPGLDAELDEASWSLIGDQHPQFALKATLQSLGIGRSDVPELGAESALGRSRRVLLREALAPAERTADWLERLAGAGGAAFVEAGVQGVRLVEAATEDEEAAAVALLLRETLETEGRTAAMVTPDVSLARRVEAKLMRWGVLPAVSHGRPLRESEAGVLICLLCELARDASEPVALAALLKHPRVSLADDADALAMLEHEGLRGPRRHESLAELAALDTLKPWARAQELVRKIESALAPLIVAMESAALTLAAFADALTNAAEALCTAPWTGADGEAAAAVLREAIEHGEELGPVAPHAAPRVLMQLMHTREVPPAPGGDPRIAIWGPLEARLQRRDLMILSGLNEGVWPQPAPEDPFLSRAMRQTLGLPAHDQRIGLAAHDFAQLISAPDVVLTRALRRDGAPTLASRWVWRLKTLIQGAQKRLVGAPDLLSWAAALDAPQAERTVRPPRPTPPADQRLKRISVTQVEQLIRDPYAVYARRILRLEPLRAVGMVASYAERGSAVHRAIERFEDGDDHALLSALLDEELARHGVAADRRAAERARLMASVSALIAWFAQRRAKGAQVFREKKGVMIVEGVELSGIADRIEIASGHAAILDFKTGAPPSDGQVKSGLAPQLPLEAAMLARGVFEGVPAAQTTELLYWRFGNADPTPRVLGVDPMEEAQNAHAELAALLRQYAKPSQPFLSKPRVQFFNRYADFDHLARRKEWADAEGED